MEVEGQNFQDSINQLVTGMASMMTKLDAVTTTVADLEGNLTKKVDNTLKEFQADMKNKLTAATKKFEDVDESMRNFAKQLDELKKRTSKLEGSPSGASASSGGPFAAPGFGPSGSESHPKPPGSPGQQPNKGAKIHFGSSIRGTRSHSQPPPARSDGESSTRLIIRVAGFGRELSKELRKKHFEEVVFPGLPADSHGQYEVTYPHMANHVLLKFDDPDSFHETLEFVRDKTTIWQDQLFKRSQTIYLKRDKTIEGQQIGRFRHHFYDGITKLLKDSYGFRGAPKLSMARGKIMVAHMDDHLPLVAFSRTLCRDKSGVDIVEESWNLLKVPLETVTQMIEVSLKEANDAHRE